MAHRLLIKIAFENFIASRGARCAQRRGNGKTFERCQRLPCRQKPIVRDDDGRPLWRISPAGLPQILVNPRLLARDVIYAPGTHNRKTISPVSYKHGGIINWFCFSVD